MEIEKSDSLGERGNTLSTFDDFSSQLYLISLFNFSYLKKCVLGL